jgi:hypothetical protein
MDTYEVLEEYIEELKPDIEQGQPVTVEVRNVDTFERLVVQAQVEPPGVAGEGYDRLILRNLAENVSSDEWSIRILEKLDPESVEIHPVSDFRRAGGEG